jgi:hypothetical protein
MSVTPAAVRRAGRSRIRRVRTKGAMGRAS